MEYAHKVSSSSGKEMDNHGMTEDLDTSFHDTTFDRSELSSEAKAIGISLIKSVSSRDKLSCGKNNLRMKNEIQERVAHASDIPGQEQKTDDENDDCSNCDNMDRLVDLIQAKIAVSRQKEKIKLLTLVPESWSTEKVIKKFHVAQYMVKKARILKK